MSRYPPAPPGEKGMVPLPLLRSYSLCRRFATPKVADSGLNVAFVGRKL
ncbi:MAG: hypothetical protein IJP39_04160 [Bacteroidales bacterium]|nr:hypothetical protein [Bacteroidales bacterium]